MPVVVSRRQPRGGVVALSAYARVVNGRSPQGDGLPISVMVCSDAAGEAEAVADFLWLDWTSGRVHLSEMAVLYRTNAQRQSLEEACLRKMLPFVVVGGQQFYDRQEVGWSAVEGIDLLHDQGVLTPAPHMHALLHAQHYVDRLSCL